MERKKQNDISIDLGTVQETALITLYYRSLSTNESPEILEDPLASELIKKIDYDFSEASKDFPTKYTGLLRTESGDKFVRDFIDKNKKSIIINLGCGLCTRYFRLNSKDLIWFDLDLPPMIAYKKTFISEGSNYHMISNSIFEYEWIEKIKSEYKDFDWENQNILIIADGLLFYLEKDKIKNFFSVLADEFPGSHFLFECIHPLLKLIIKIKWNTISDISYHKWALLSPRLLRFWDKRIKYKKTLRFFNRHKKYIKWMRILGFLPLYRSIHRLVYIQFKK